MLTTASSQGASARATSRLCAATLAFTRTLACTTGASFCRRSALIKGKRCHRRRTTSTTSTRPITRATATRSEASNRTVAWASSRWVRPHQPSTRFLLRRRPSSYLRVPAPWRQATPRKIRNRRLPLPQQIIIKTPIGRPIQLTWHYCGRRASRSR